MMNKKDDIYVCPYCKSDNVSLKKKPGYAVMLSLLLFGLPLPIFKKCYHCFDCEKEWNDKMIPPKL